MVNRTMRNIFCLCWLLFLPVLFGQELKIEKTKKSMPGTPTYTFTIVNGTDQYQYWHTPSVTPHVGPLGKGNLFAYGAILNLFVVDASKKQLIRREVLPEKPHKITWIDDTTLDVSVAMNDNEEVATYRIPVYEKVSLSPSGSLLASSCDMRDVESQMGKLGLYLAGNEKNKHKKEPALDQAATRLNELAQFDITNPWVEFYQGLLAFRKGSPEEASKIWQAVSELPKARWYHLSKMGIELHLLEQTRMGQVFHAAAMRKMGEDNIFPPLQLTLIQMMMHKGNLGPKIAELRGQGKLEEASALLEEYYEYAPHCEFFSWVMNSFGNELDKAGKVELARTWKQRAEETQGFIFFTGLGMDERVLGLVLTGAYACILALILVVLCMLLKAPHLQFPSVKDTPRIPIFGSAAWVGIILVVAMGVVLAMVAGAGIRGVEFSAGTRMGIMYNFTHPLTHKWIDRAAESPAKHFYRGLAYQNQGDYAKARAEYAQASQFPQSYNNLAILDKAEGKDPAANFAKALELDPRLPEALWNTKKEATSAWARVHQKYWAERPMLAMPTGAMHTCFLSHPIWDSKNLLENKTLQLARFIQITASEAGFFKTIQIFVLGIFLFLALLLLRIVVARFAKSVPVPGKVPFTWWAAVLLPGSSKLWSIFGGLVSVLWVTSVSLIIINWDDRLSFPVLSFLEGISIPGFYGYGAMGEPLNLGSRLAILWGARVLAVLLPVLNLIFLVKERRHMQAAAEQPKT